jgi:UTP:GlnB (protein PII) uridylyltransferase
VDEHTFLTIDNVHNLRQPTHDFEARLAQLLPEIDRLDLFLLALLLHDTGKARRTGEHADHSVEFADAFLARLDFDAEERETVLKLIRLHLDMSQAMRRDIFDMENVRAFSEKIGSPQVLKMLTIMTFADIKAVNPGGADAMEGRESLAVLHVDGQLHGSFGGRGSLPRGDRSDAAEPAALDGAFDPIRGAGTVS